MEEVIDRPMLNDILIEAAKLGPKERYARIRRCVAEGRHDPDKLPACVAPASPQWPRQPVRYCDHCWSLIDPHGLTWSWAPEQSG
jgi:hypothetical protein